MKPRTLSSARRPAGRVDPKSLLAKKPNPAEKTHSVGDQDTTALSVQQNLVQTPEDQPTRLEHAQSNGKPPNVEMEVTITRAEANSGEPERKKFVVSEVYTQLEELRNVLNHANMEEITVALMGDPFLAGAFYSVLSDLNML